GMDRIDRGEHGRITNDAGDAEDRESAEPDQHDRAEDRADPAGSMLLEQKEADEDDDGDRHDELRQGGCGDLETLDRGEDRDRGRDDSVAIEKRCSEETQRKNEAVQTFSFARLRVYEAHEGEDPPLSAVVHP